MAESDRFQDIFEMASHAERLSVGVIGLGVGEKLAEGFSRDSRCELAVICDIDPVKLRDVISRLPSARAEENPDAVLDDPQIDVVALASYDNFHFQQAMRALANGKHVFVEKPFVIHDEEARSVRALLNERPNQRLSSNLILRQSPRFLDLKRRIGSCEMGDLFYLEGDYNYGRLEKIMSGWRGKMESYSAVHGGGIHLVDLLMWLAEDAIVEVSAVGNQIASRDSGFQNFDMVVTTLRFAGGAIGKIGVNFGCVFPHFHNVAVYGTKATFVNGMPAAKLYTSRDPAVEPELLHTPYPGAHKGALIPSFVDAILGVGPALVTEADVFRCMNVCFAIEQSAHEGRPVAVVA
jgi:predicted dehydrogenase